jgi:UDP-N-acetylmuramoyl-L-alanyl-D-glutamate--2,6-diaminopimelate ligase
MNGEATGAEVEITGLTADSREVAPGYLFAALRGSSADGAKFVPDALARGAVAVLAHEGAGIDLPDDGVRLIADANPRRRLALMAARFHGAQPETIAAVTGTNGKTSVAAFTRQMWKRMGFRAASLGTLGIIEDGDLQPLPNTTPDPVMLHAALAGLAGRGIDHLAIEASSHGLDQCRMDGVRIAAAAFTNLTQDHLDYHPDAVAYFAAKARLFDTVMAAGGVAVINADAPQCARLAGICRDRGHRVLTFGTTTGDLRLVEATPDGDRQRIVVEIDGRREAMTFPFAGGFQTANALCAGGLVMALGGSVDDVMEALPALEGVPGRIEYVARHPVGANIYVDYAHTPDALTNVLNALRPHTIGRLVVVFGCGGDRDKDKRPMMGEIAARLADRAIVTDDNPRGEDAAAIRREILAACPAAIEIGDRAAAIRSAVGELEAGDLLVVAGKGHERGQIVAGHVIDFDDADNVRAVVAALRKGGS